jgi:hypothetical protein
VRKVYLPVLIIIVLIIYFLPDSPKASENDLNNRDKVLQFLESAYQAQISLSELDRSMEEIHFILDPYFTREYQENFFEANLHEENGLYFTYGTDFGELFVPFFKFSEFTKVVFNENEIFVFEYFPKNLLGPVGYDSHYEGLLIKRAEEQWKISDYLYNQIPEDIIKKALEQ